MRSSGRLSQQHLASALPPQVPEPHEDFGDWWTLYDYGPETVASWKKGCAASARPPARVVQCPDPKD